jgi:hypothetical protein
MHRVVVRGEIVHHHDDADTPKRSAAARRDRPPATAAITRSRKSPDSDFAMHAGLPSSMQCESKFESQGNP